MSGSPTFRDRDAALREEMAGRRMAEPKDEHAFWQEQRERKSLPIVDPIFRRRRPPLWLWLMAVPLVGVALISIARGVL